MKLIDRNKKYNSMRESILNRIQTIRSDVGAMLFATPECDELDRIEFYLVEVVNDLCCMSDLPEEQE